ncbi:MAG: SDR family NAD(P)-dependent oxidoreductase [Coriobacteriales bacterium]|nr:SDR family NAD(P)-dependent oxidoreductase [Coriobacteriales bacterium]
MKSIAVVTGASSGVGREFVAQLCDRKGGPLDEIWIIARSKDTLEEMAAASTNVTIRPIPLDLMDDASFATLEAMLEDEKPCVQWLVNSAGFGVFGAYGDVGAKANANMVRLNCLALVQMMSVCLPHMQPGSCIVNLASIAGVIPQPFLATYSASKAFVQELSRMLNHELRGTGIHVIAVCPKFMHTKFLDKPGDNEAADAMTRIGFEEVEHVVSLALRLAVLGYPMSISCLDMQLAALATKLLPRKCIFFVEDLFFGRLGKKDEAEAE